LPLRMPPDCWSADWMHREAARARACAVRGSGPEEFQHRLGAPALPTARDGTKYQVFGLWKHGNLKSVRLAPKGREPATGG
jgi:hypothetical protein